MFLKQEKAYVVVYLTTNFSNGDCGPGIMRQVWLQGGVGQTDLAALEKVGL